MLKLADPANTEKSGLKYSAIAPPVKFETHFSGDTQRPQLEHYIAEQYQNFYGATVTDFLPVLVEMQFSCSSIAALGLRPGDSNPMFLESYLDFPVEQNIARHVKQPVFRGDIVEVGNLVATKSGASRLLFVVMTAILAGADYRWMVFTATPQVEKLIKRLNFNPIFLSDANPGRLGSEAYDWGTYYACRPKVMVGNIGNAMEALGDNMDAQQILKRHRLAITRMSKNLRKFHRLQGN